MSLTLNDLRSVLDLFRESAYREMRLGIGSLSITVRNEGTTATALPGAATVVGEPDDASAEVAEGVDTVAVRATISGTFYRTPSPGADAFCKVGDRVQADTTVGLIEVMKLFTSVQAGISGTVLRIVPENGTLVESGQPLLLIQQDEVRP